MSCLIVVKIKGGGYKTLETTHKTKAESIVKSIMKNGFVHTYDDGIGVYHAPSILEDIRIVKKSD